MYLYRALLSVHRNIPLEIIIAIVSNHACNSTQIISLSINLIRLNVMRVMGIVSYQKIRMNLMLSILFFIYITIALAIYTSINMFTLLICELDEFNSYAVCIRFFKGSSYRHHGNELPNQVPFQIHRIRNCTHRCRASANWQIVI